MGEWGRKMGSTLRNWSWFKKTMMLFSLMLFLSTSFLYLTPAGASLREFSAATFIGTQHRSWAWIFVGGAKRDLMVAEKMVQVSVMGDEEQELELITLPAPAEPVRRSKEELIRVEDISKPFFKGKMMWVYDPKSIRMVVTAKAPMGERITEMVKRTGAVAGVNAGGFDDPDGLGNGFAPIGMIMSDSEIMYADVKGKQPIVGFTDEGKLVVGNYTLDDLRELKVKEAASFYPRVILDGKPLITNGNGSSGRDPRTAVGQKADGTVIFIVIDGRQPTHSLGATLKEVQDLFLEQGVVNAGFLDGGASAEMVVDGELITKPSSRYGERRLPSAFLIFDRPQEVAVTSPWKGISVIDPGGAKSHPEFLAEQQRLREQASARSSAARPEAAPASPAEEAPQATAKPAPAGTPKPSPSGAGAAPAGAEPGPGGADAAASTKPTPAASMPAAAVPPAATPAPAAGAPAASPAVLPSDPAGSLAAAG
ncbi:phosphodiester glycosidase family protein [Paenibacillus sp. CC-CFT747]|nr:phosphodiester glycosidase family protein [Paenibacillus sp. CC-CFT747]